MKAAGFIAAAIISISSFLFAAEPQKGSPLRLEQAQKILGADVPRLLCLDENFATGGQPTSDAYGKAAASGFISVLSLRTAGEGVDLVKERARVENRKLRYFNVPVASSSPRAAQADEFLRITRNKANHPMLVTCATANRVGAFMMILRVVEQGWSEEKALNEAIKIGLRGEELKKFAKDYIAGQKLKRRLS
jgi:protein tyrosine phosphatase (PTP) superfamily phosphohydrolase (DUF442 family)